MFTVAAGARPANPTDAVVSAEADQRMAMDAMEVAKRAYERVRDAMMQQATDVTFYTWQERVKVARKAADNAVASVVEASKAVCRARRQEA